MADEHEVRAAVADAVSRMEDLDDETRRKVPERTISAVVTDLDLAWSGRFASGHLVDVREIPPEEARAAAFRLRLSSDTLVDLVEERLGFATGWTHGKIRVDAGFRDILALRAFL